MKAKYNKRKNLKNASETFIYNTDKYCEIIAKKFGKDKKQAKEYFDKFFQFLDDRRLLTESVKARLNKNIKTFILNYADSQSMGGGLMGFYLPSENSITLNKAFNYNKENVLIHEFIHLLTSQYGTIDKKRVKKVFPFGKGTEIATSVIGFFNIETSEAKYDYYLMSGNLNASQAKEFLSATLNFVNETQINTADMWFNKITGEHCSALNKLVFDDSNIDYDYIIETPSEEENTPNDDNIPTEEDNISENSNENAENELTEDAVLTATVSEEDLNMIKNHIDTVVNDFISKSKKPFKVNLVVAEDYVISINHNGNGKYYVQTYFCENIYDNECEESPGRNFTEGMTEFLARYFASYFENKNILSTCAYNTFVKYAEMLYRIYGDELLETFFDQSKKSFARLTDSSIEEVDKLFNNVDDLLEYFQSDLEAYTTCHKEVMSFIYDKLANKIVYEVASNLHAFNNCREVDHCIQQSLLEFSKSLYFGWSNNLLQQTRVDVINELAVVYSDIINVLKTAGESEALVNMYGWEETSKLTSLKEPNSKKLEDFFSDANFVCDNSYFFTNKDLKEIHPTDFVNGKSITTYDNKRQEYLRKKAKFPTVENIHLLHHTK